MSVRAEVEAASVVQARAPLEVVEAIVEQRVEMRGRGHDAGAATIAYHLAQQRKDVPSLSTIWRILKREGLVVAQPQKRPRCSLIRSRPSCQTRCGRPTSPTGSSRAASTQRSST
jgi:hypothetical protein